MSFLKRFFMNVLHDEEQGPHRSSFEEVSDRDLEAHLRVAQYGDFRLTDAVRPAYDLKVRPAQGYRHDTYRDEASRSTIPVLMSAVSAEILFDVFMEVLDPLGSEVDVVLETSHHRRQGGHQDLYREQIDLPVLKSILWDYEDLLLNDGCTGIAVINPAAPQEIQFDEHKLLIIYGDPLDAFEEILQSRGVFCEEELQFLTEAEHVHSSKDTYAREFDEMKMRLGLDEDLFD